MTRPTLATDRLRLEPLAEEHAELLVELDSDPEVLRHIFGRALSREESLAALSLRMDPDSDEQGFGLWVGFEGCEAGPSFAGWWCLLLDADPTTAELGYRLPQSAWGRGLATEGSRAMLDHAFGGLGLASVWAQTRDTNLESRRVLAKCGLRHVGWLEPTVLRYELTREEWSSVGELTPAPGTRST
jgi:RimJ/RimL family protein N-acetyltransferase